MPLRLSRGARGQAWEPRVDRRHTFRPSDQRRIGRITVRSRIPLTLCAPSPGHTEHAEHTETPRPTTPGTSAWQVKKIAAEGLVRDGDG